MLRLHSLRKKTNMNKFTFRLFLLLFFVFSVFISAAQDIEIRKSGIEKINIKIDRFSANESDISSSFLNVLKQDLLRSGWFKFGDNKNAYLINMNLIIDKKIRIEVYIKEYSKRQIVYSFAYSSSLNNYRGLAHKTADKIILCMTGKKGISSSKLAIVGSPDGFKELYTCDIDGENLRKVTNDKSIVVAPKWSFDNKSILYTSYKAGYPNVYQTGRKNSLSNYGGLNVSASISPDNKYMALILSKDGNPELYLKELKTGKLKRLTLTRDANEASPCWSPYGNEIAYVSDTSGRPHIYVINISGGKPRRISKAGSENVSPDWGINGLIAYCSRQSGSYKIVIADPKNNKLKLIPLDNADYEDPCWAPDGRHIIASRSVNYQSSIYLLDTVEERRLPLLKQKGNWFSPSCTY